MTITIMPTHDAEARIWATALEVSELFADVPWVLIGAQMVMLLEREVGRTSGRTTGDVDAIVDVRTLAGGTRTAARRLVAAGYELDAAEHPHRFRRGDAQVDLLAPDHLGPRVDLTTIPPAVTIEIPGGTRALSIRRSLEVDVTGVGSGSLPVPSLAGSVLFGMSRVMVASARSSQDSTVGLLAGGIAGEGASSAAKATTLGAARRHMTTPVASAIP
jgi:hypothetical protein